MQTPGLYDTKSSNYKNISAHGRDLEDSAGMKGTGPNSCYKEYSLENKVHCLLASFQPGDYLPAKKRRVNPYAFNLSFYEIFSSGNLLAKTTLNYYTRQSKKNDVVAVTGSLPRFNRFSSKDSHIKLIEFSIPLQVLFARLSLRSSYGVFEKFIQFMHSRKPVTFNTHSTAKIFHAVIRDSEGGKPVSGSLGIHLSTLLTMVYSYMGSALHDFLESERIKISREEIIRLIAVRKQLDSGDPRPSFASLTRMALMSSTSLKTKFKKMYGTSIYRYFQRTRMQRARILLQTGKFSIKQIGRHLGYANLSNFSVAFKKEFHQLPKELIR